MEETTVTQDVTQTPVINADSSTEDILASAPQEEAQPQEETSTPEDSASNPTGEVAKTPEEETKLEAEQEAALIESGKPIPYDRFKQVINKRNDLQKEISTLQAQVQQVQELFKDPDIVKTVMKKQGYADEAISKYLKEQGIAPQDKPTDTKTQLKELVKDLDLSTVDGWLEAQARIADFQADKKSKEALSAYDNKRMTEEQAKTFIATNEAEARKLAKDTYNIPFGESGKDEANTNTAIGKISAYLDKNPADAYLGHVKLLRLAMSEEGFRAAEQKGVQKEKARVEKVKAAALESDETFLGEEHPDKNWSTDQIMAWREKHPTAVI